MTTGRTTSGPKNGGDRPVLGPEAQPLLKRSGLWSDDLPWRRPLLTPSLMWTGDLDWSGAGWGRDTRGRIRRLSWRLSYVWLAALARGDVMDPALLRFRRMLNGDFSRPLEGPQHARHTLPALKDQQRVRTSQRARAPLPTRAPTARTREVWIPTQKEATSPPQKWQREQRKAEVQHRQPLPSSPLRPSTRKPVESLVGVSSDSPSSTKNRRGVPDTVTPTGSSTLDRGASAGGGTQKRDVASATTAAKSAQRTPRPSAVVGAATEVHRETQNLPKGTRQTDTTPTNRQSRTSAVSGESSGERSEQSATVQSSEKARARDTTQSSVPTETTPGAKRPSGSGTGKIQRVGRDRSQSTAKLRESSPKTSVWAKTDRQTGALPSWQPGATRPGWRLDPWSRESTTPRWQLDPWQPSPWDQPSPQASRNRLSRSQSLSTKPSERGARTVDPVAAESPQWRQPVREQVLSGSVLTRSGSSSGGSSSSGPSGVGLRSGRRGAPIGVRVGMRPVLLKVPGGAGGGDGPPPSPESVLRAAVQSRDAADRVWAGASDQPAGLKRRLETSERIRAQREADRRRERGVAREIVDRLQRVERSKTAQRVERTKVLSKDSGGRLTQRRGDDVRTGDGPSSIQPKSVSKPVNPRDVAGSGRRLAETRSNNRKEEQKPQENVPAPKGSVRPSTQPPETASGSEPATTKARSLTSDVTGSPSEDVPTKQVRSLSNQSEPSSPPATPVRSRSSVEDPWSKRRVMPDSQRWTSPEEARLVSPTRVMEWGRRDRRGNPAKVRFARMPDLSEWLIDRRPLPDSESEPMDPRVQALRSSRVRDPNLPTDLRFSPQWRGRSESSARRNGPVIPYAGEARRGSSPVGTSRTVGRQSQGDRDSMRRTVARRMQAAPLRAPTTQWMHDREVTRDVPRPSAPSRVRRGPSTPSVDFNSSARQRSRQWARQRVQRARTFEQERLERTAQERIDQKTKQQESTRERTEQRRQARSEERRRDSARAARQQMDAKRRAEQGRGSRRTEQGQIVPERPSGPPPLRRSPETTGTAPSSPIRKSDGGPPPLRPPSALGATPWRGMGSKQSPMEWSLAPGTREASADHKTSRGPLKRPAFSSTSKRILPESGGRRLPNRRSSVVSGPMDSDGRTVIRDGQPQTPSSRSTTSSEMPWLKSTDSDHANFADRRLIEGWRSPQMSGPRLAKDFVNRGYVRRAEGDQLGRPSGRLSPGKGRISSPENPGSSRPQAVGEYETNVGTAEEPWRASTAVESAADGDVYQRAGYEGTSSQRTTASRRLKQSASRRTGRARRGPTRRSSGQGYYRQDRSGQGGNDEAMAKGQDSGPRRGAPQKSTWRAPESVRAALVEKPKDPAPAPRRTETTESSLESLTEREMMTVLRTLATNSPEARSLLKEVRRQVAEHRYLWKLRQY